MSENTDAGNCLSSITGGLFMGFVVGASMGLIFVPLRRLRGVGTKDIIKNSTKHLRETLKQNQEPGSANRISPRGTARRGMRPPSRWKKMGRVGRATLTGGIFFSLIMGVGGALRCFEDVILEFDEDEQKNMWQKMLFLNKKQQ